LLNISRLSIIGDIRSGTKPAKSVVDMSLSRKELDVLLAEYKETCESLRERHRTIWYVRSFFMITLTAFATYGASVRLPILSSFAFLVFMGLLMIAFDIKYQRAKTTLEDHAIKIGNKIGISTQYSGLQGRRKIPYWLQFVLIYALLFSGFVLWFMTWTLSA